MTCLRNDKETLTKSVLLRRPTIQLETPDSAFASLLPAIISNEYNNEMTPIPALPRAVTNESPIIPINKTMAHQAAMPHLPIPPLVDTMNRYLRALQGLQVRLTYVPFRSPQLVIPMENVIVSQ